MIQDGLPARFRRTSGRLRLVHPIDGSPRHVVRVVGDPDIRVRNEIESFGADSCGKDRQSGRRHFEDLSAVNRRRCAAERASSRSVQERPTSATSACSDTPGISETRSATIRAAGGQPDRGQPAVPPAVFLGRCRRSECTRHPDSAASRDCQRRRAGTDLGPSADRVRSNRYPHRCRQLPSNGRRSIAHQPGVGLADGDGASRTTSTPIFRNARTCASAGGYTSASTG